MGPIVLFTHLKIISLQYFQFQFSISTKISSIQTDPKWFFFFPKFPIALKKKKKKKNHLSHSGANQNPKAQSDAKQTQITVLHNPTTAASTLLNGQGYCTSLKKKE